MELRYYQEEAVEAAWNEIHEGRAALIQLATGLGKSICQAALVMKILAAYPKEKILLVVHSQELVESNYEEIRKHLKRTQVSMYCAGTSQKVISQVTVASIKSIYKVEYFHKYFGVLVVDETDLIPTKDTTLYRSFINECLRHNKEIALVGLTATPFRLDSGEIYGPGELFPKICYAKKLVESIREGWLCPLTAKERDTVDTTGLHIRGGDYVASELSERMSAMELVTRHAADIVDKSKQRNCVLIFCVSTEHCIALTKAIKALGGKAEFIVSDTKLVSKRERDQRFFDFKQGRLKYLLNVEIATVGVNIPQIDHIVLMRLSKSKRLILQMLGRGTRRHPSKTDCKVSDYAGVFHEHGRIDDLEEYNYASKKAGGGTAPIRICIACDGVNHASVAVCEQCGHVFPKPDPENHVNAFRGPISSLDQETYEVMQVQEVRYFNHLSKQGIDTLKIVYYEKGVLGRNIVEYMGPCHRWGSIVEKTKNWWATVSNNPIPSTVDEILDIADTLPIPVAIQYKKEGKYMTVVDRIWEEEVKNAGCI